MIKHKNKQGFTLIEMVLYIGLLTVFLFVLTQMFLGVLDVQLETEATSSVNQDGRYILSRFIYDVSRADSISYPANPGDQAPTMQLSINGQTLTYVVSNGDLVIYDAVGTVNLNSFESAVSDILFTRLGNPDGKNSVQMQITLGSKVTKTGENTPTVFETAAGLR